MRISVLTLIALAIIILSPLSGVLAQGVPPVQELHGSLAPGQIDVFLVEGLKKGIHVMHRSIVRNITT